LFCLPYLIHIAPQLARIFKVQSIDRSVTIKIVHCSIK
jgi:hypothetical protein